jgi:hypothetical protein
MASLVGSGVHAYVETLLKQANNNRYELERSVFKYMGERYVTGRFDILLDQEHIFDIKTGKTWKTVFDPGMVDWHRQQNIYAYLLRDRGVKIKTINIMAIYLDWMEGSAARDPNYPQLPLQYYSLDLWDMDEAEAYIMERLEMNKVVEDMPDDDLPACTREERWERFPNGDQVQYAVMKHKKAKRAMRVFNTERDACEYCMTKAKGLTEDSVIEVRYAKRKRCESWCPVASRCNHYKIYCQKKKTNTLNDYIPYQHIMGGVYHE